MESLKIQEGFDQPVLYTQANMKEVWQIGTLQNQTGILQNH